jgi:predicted nucleotidyltransferase
MTPSFDADLCCPARLGKNLSSDDVLLSIGEHKYYIGTAGRKGYRLLGWFFGTVNGNDGFLAKVTRVIVFGSYLRAGVDRLSDVDIAVELAPKERRRNDFRELNYRRVAQAESKGHRFSGILDRELWWRSETFRFLKGRSRSISLVDYKKEKEFVDKVPRRTLLCTAEAQREPPKKLLKHVRLARRPKSCPF